MEIIRLINYVKGVIHAQETCRPIPETFSRNLHRIELRSIPCKSLVQVSAKLVSPFYWKTQLIKIFCMSHAIEAAINGRSGVARIWCEDGHETKRK